MEKNRVDHVLLLLAAGASFEKRDLRSSKWQQLAQNRDQIEAARREIDELRTPSAARSTTTQYGSLELLPPATATTLDEASVAIASRTWRIAFADIEVGNKLGEGAFGEVWQGCWHGMHVALKQVKFNSLGGAKASADFQNEVLKMASLQPHVNIVVLYGLTTLPTGDLAAVLEFCAQGALANALNGARPRQWSADELLQVAHDAACGLAHLHRNDLVHRDIAARNVLLAGTRDTVAKIADSAWRA